MYISFYRSYREILVGIGDERCWVEQRTQEVEMGVLSDSVTGNLPSRH